MNKPTKIDVETKSKMRPAVQQLRKLEPSREQLIPIMRKYPETNIYKRFGTSREQVRYLKKSLGR